RAMPRPASCCARRPWPRSWRSPTGASACRRRPRSSSPSLAPGWSSAPSTTAERYRAFVGGGLSRDDDAGDAVLYVTFSGEQEKGGRHPVDNVVGLDTEGRVAVPGVLGELVPEVSLHILRGMAFGPDGYLYVANAHKAHSMILTFGPPDRDGVRAMVGDRPFA